ncbi:hypothetical protein C9374_011264 [Naegleria lovaniensis]|uniref:Uncharacterized protein n=1 Tax=Naegleria lovaniensis TaxID=51637 RepID=A0AA88H2M8_NAELO|nr:uncharacterized protein C9374_011264 [Naegleria lovaniensis]KAG2392539.1 hypothetical protein C9374_011264 [Naegleria lovaniensis]
MSAYFFTREIGRLIACHTLFSFFSHVFNEGAILLSMELLLGKLITRVLLVYMAVLGVRDALRFRKLSFKSVTFHRWLLLSFSLWYLVIIKERIIREEYDQNIKNKWFPDVYYMKEHDVYIDFTYRNNAVAIGGKTSVVFPKKTSLWDYASTFLFSSHNWPPNALNALVSHEKGHNATFIAMVAVQMWILCFCYENVKWYFFPFVFVVGNTMSGWFFELVADSNVLHLQGIELMSVLGLDEDHFGSLGVNSHPPIFLRKLTYQTDRLLWKYCFQYLNYLVGIYTLFWFWSTEGWKKSPILAHS